MVATPQPIAGQAYYTAVCEAISHAISSASSVNWPGSGQFYTADIEHYASSSSMQSACSVEPGTEEDIAIIVKSGGHCMNPQYSSTPGVHIAMSRFNEVKYDAEANVAEVGAGLIWDDVYGALDPQGVTVLGGRASGIGVGGLALGGGYSWKTNQFGLTVDNLTGHKVVLADGRILTVNAQSYPDLFWGLKGIVTKFNLTTYPQTEIWGGTISVNATYINEVNAATAKFSQTVADPKAQILPSYTFVQGQVRDILTHNGVMELTRCSQLIASISLFYDSPDQPKSIFDDFLAIPNTAMDLKTRPLRDFVRTAPTNSTLGLRGVYNTVSVLNYTEHMLEAIVNETKFWGERLPPGASSVTYSTEPFLSSIFSHASVDSSAYPPNRSVGPSPLAIAFAWNDSSADAAIHDAARKSAAQLTQVMLSEGQNLQNVPLYGNYAIFDTPLEKIYGVHLPKLQALRAKYDPYHVMGLAGGWKF
ncbi:hypothetical protein ACG7TL_002074 [Trametes sanguinea]